MQDLIFFNFHQEVEGDLADLIGQVKAAGMKAGLDDHAGHAS